MAREAQLLLYSPAVMSMDSYPVQQLPEERFVIFVTATTGQASMKPTHSSCLHLCSFARPCMHDSFNTRQPC